MIFTITDDEGKEIKKVAGQEWLENGPKIYYPNVDVEVVERVSAFTIKVNEGIWLKARVACVDVNGVKRVANEQWIYRTPGMYLPG